MPCHHKRLTWLQEHTGWLGMTLTHHPCTGPFWSNLEDSMADQNGRAESSPIATTIQKVSLHQEQTYKDLTM